ncbi:MAG: ABC transporter ATP-binding protein [Acidobacteria bacterium]|nr:MAG: ABC transporter ATP-binding protein [Acidobacteriota bacterium]
MAVPSDRIVLDDVSKFYGEVLGVNRVRLSIGPGITGLVGPNGSGKTTLMNLVAGLLRPTEGEIRVLGVRPDDPERLFRLLGYCTQHDSFPRGMTGMEFLARFLRVAGYDPATARRLAVRAIERVGLEDAAERRVASYSKGMRQRIKLAQAMAHDPPVLILDEPLNGLDPMARAETIALFRELAAEGRYLIVSSHILHEVDLISDTVIMLNQGYVVAEGAIREVRREVSDKPLKILVRCDRPEVVAARAFEQDSVTEVRLHEDRRGLLVSTRDPEAFYLLLNRIVLENDLAVEQVAPADETVQAVYSYLIGEGEAE